MGSLRRGSEIVPQWFYIPPPYDQVDAIRLQGSPIGAKHTSSVRPRETVQIIGQSKSVVPHVVTKDLGWVDLRIVDGSRIEFAAGGLETDVGTRDPSPTVGMSLREGGNVLKAPKGRVVSASPAGVSIPAGSLTWASGTTGEGVSRVQRVRWYYLPPPYDGEVIPLSGPPHGVSDPALTTPLATVQIVGRSRKAIPVARIDLGFAEVRIAGGSVKEILPKMEEVEATATSQRAGVPAKQPTEKEIARQVSATMKAEADKEVTEEELDMETMTEQLEEPEEEPVLESAAIKTRVGLSKKVTRSKKPLTEFDYMTTLKGFNPYTFEGM